MLAPNGSLSLIFTGMAAHGRGPLAQHAGGCLLDEHQSEALDFLDAKDLKRSGSGI